LNSVFCLDPTTCVAAGLDGDQTLVEAWNGVGWTSQSSPDPGASSNQLFGVTCTSARACLAVGDDQATPTRTLSLVESWDGHVWSAVPSPTEGTAYDQLNSISCLTVTRCVAVGVSADRHLGTSGPERTLVDSWNGSHWTVTPSPDQGSLDSDLTAVSCTSQGCVAVGWADNAAGQYFRPVVESGGLPG
jgi:hypothetical protein